MAVAIKRRARFSVIATLIAALALIVQPFAGLQIPSVFAASRTVDVTISPNPTSGAEYVEFSNNSGSDVDINGKYSPIQTKADGETKVVNDTEESVVTESDREKVRNQTESNDSRGRQFENCTAAFEAGVFNIRRSDPSYQNKLDRDNDGIACER